MQEFYSYMPQRTESRVLIRYRCTHVRSIIPNSQKMEAPKCPSTDEWISKMWSILDGPPNSDALLFRLKIRESWHRM